VGDRVAIAGNMDPVACVLDGTPALIQNAVLSAYEAVGNPYIVNAGCEIPSRTPAENLRALCEPVLYQA
jgi:uroporphyrinogen decarboxylase